MAKQSTKQGFTIIEVVLVLAIAGLIFLMVFVALPALQRSQRDTQRREDMSRVSNALTQYQTNNSTKVDNLPSDGTYNGEGYTSGSASDFVKKYMNTADATENSFIDPDGTTYKVNISTYNENTPVSPTTFDHTVYIVKKAQCDGESTKESTARFFAILYRLEGSGTFCLDNQ